MVKEDVVSGSLWQKPFVDVFKLVDLNGGSWGKVSREGNVRMLLDKEIGKNVIRVTGSTSTTSSVEIPERGSLGLTGRYIYVQLKPIPPKLFTINIEVLGQDKFLSRLTISNMFRVFRRRGNAIQIPADLGDAWYTLAIDLPQILAQYKDTLHSDQYWCVKSIKVFPNVFVRNVFTAEHPYSLDGQGGLEAFPRPLMLSRINQERIDELIWIPEQPNATQPTAPPTLVVPKDSIAAGSTFALPAPGQSPRRLTANLPEPMSRSINTNENTVMNPLPSAPPAPAFAKTKGHMRQQRPEVQKKVHGQGQLKRTVTLRPDPIMGIQTYLGFSSGRDAASAIWSRDGKKLIVPSSCNILVAYVDHVKQDQQILFGHTANVSCLALDYDGRLLASSQSGKNPVIRIWDMESFACIAVIATCPSGGLRSLDFSSDESFLCAVGRDEHNRTQVCVWDVANIRTQKGHKYTLVAKQISEFDITKVKFSPYDSCQLVSCGRENIRFWRVRNRHLPGSPVILNEYARNCTFTDFAFESNFGGGNSIHGLANTSFDKRVFFSSDAGSVVAIHYERRILLCVYRLHDGPIHCIAVNEGFCVTGSADDYVRVWPLDFDDFFLEAKHDSPVASVDISPDGLQILIGTRGGNLGVLDITNHSHESKLRTHSGGINCVCFRNTPSQSLREMATAGTDGTVRIWAVPSLEHMYEFASPGDAALNVVYHPSPDHHLVVAGFSTGFVRFFDVAGVVLAFEYKQHVGAVDGVCFGPEGRFVYSVGADGQACVYHGEQSFQPVKMIAVTSSPLLNMSTSSLTSVMGASGLFSARNKQSSPAEPGLASSIGKRIAIDGNGKLLAAIAPQEPNEIVVLQNLTSLEDISVALRVKKPARSFAKQAGFLSVSFSPDSTELVASSQDNRIFRFRVLFSASDGWEATLVREIHSFHPEWVSCFCTSPQLNAFLVTAGSDHMLQVWDYRMRGSVTGTPCIQRFLGHSNRILDVAFSTDCRYLVSVGEDQTIILWNFYGNESDHLSRALLEGKDSTLNLVEGEKVAFDAVLESQVESARESLPSCHRVDKDPVVSLEGDTANHGAMFVLGTNGLASSNLVWHPMSGLFAYSHGRALVVESLSSREQQVYAVHRGSISSTALSSCGTRIATGSSQLARGHDEASARMSAEIVLWKVLPTSENDNSIAELGYTVMLGHLGGGVQDLCFSPDATRLCSIGNVEDGMVSVWSVEQGTLLWSQRMEFGIGHRVTWVKQSTLITTGALGQITVWVEQEQASSKDSDESESQLVFQEDVLCMNSNSLVEPSQHITCIALAPEWVCKSHDSDAVVVVADQQGRMTILALPLRNVLAQWQAADTEITNVAWCQRSIICSTAAGYVVDWKLGDKYPASGSLPTHVVRVGPAIRDICWQDEGAEGVVSCQDGSILYVNVQEGSVVQLVQGVEADVDLVSCDAVGSLCASYSSQERALRVWACRTMELVSEITIAKHRVTALTFFELQGYQGLLVGQENGYVRLVSLETLAVTQTLMVDERAVTDLLVSGSWLILSLDGGQSVVGRKLIHEGGDNVQLSETKVNLLDVLETSLERPTNAVAAVAVSRFHPELVGFSTNDGAVVLLEFSHDKIEKLYTLEQVFATWIGFTCAPSTDQPAPVESLLCVHTSSDGATKVTQFQMGEELERLSEREWNGGESLGNVVAMCGDIVGTDTGVVGRINAAGEKDDRKDKAEEVQSDVLGVDVMAHIHVHPVKSLAVGDGVCVSAAANQFHLHAL